MRLNTLLKSAGLKKYIQPTNDTLEITSVCCDSREAGKDSVFVCIIGSVSDGHAFAPAAYAHGCRVFVVSHLLSLPDDAMQLVCFSTRKALADLASAFYGSPSRRMKVIGITGTKGKTTSALMAAHILNRAGIPTGYIGTSGVIYNGKAIPTVNTTPESLELQRVMRDMADSGIRALVMEVSSQGLYLERVRGVSFDTVCFTNFSPDHIGGIEHPSLEHYAASKRKLFTDFGAKSAVYNADDKMSAYMTDEFKGKEKISFSCADTNADLYLKNSELTRSEDQLGARGTVLSNGVEYQLELPMPGTFNLMNALCAIAAAGTLGISPTDAFSYISDVSAPGRFQTVNALPGSGVSFIVDYAHNGLALESALITLRKYRPKRLICLFGSVGGRTQLRRRELGEVASQLADFCILTSDNPNYEPPRQVISDIAAAFKPGASCPYICIPDRTEAVRYAISIAHEGDIVLLAGKGAENFQLINGKRVPYSDIDALFECAAATV